MNLPQKLLQTFDFNIGKLTISPTYWQAAAIIFLIFLLILTLASVRRHYIHWSFKGAWFGFFIGVVMTFILEGFLIVSGRTALTELLGWKNPPKPIKNALDLGRSKLVDVLGITKEVPSSTAKEEIKIDQLIEDYQSLNPNDSRRAKKLICEP